MSILSGWLKTRAYRKTTDGYKKESRDTSSETVFMNDGNTAETNLGDIKGITDSLTATSSNVALSAKGGNSLQGQINTLNSNLKLKGTHNVTFLMTSKTQYGNLYAGFIRIPGYSTVVINEIGVIGRYALDSSQFSIVPISSEIIAIVVPETYSYENQNINSIAGYWCSANISVT